MISRNILTIKNITKTYHNRKVLDNVNLSICKGEFVAIVGNSGSGKSTLLNIIALLERPDSGEYFLEDKKLTSLFINAAKIRNEQIGFVFQSYCLVPNRDVRDNILMPLVYAKRKLNKKEVLKWYEDLLDILNIKNLELQVVNTLSGGEKQRVAIARALILKPTIIIADEPTGNLDEECASNIMDIFTDINNLGYTIIFVTHNKTNALRAKRVVKLKNGALYEQLS